MLNYIFLPHGGHRDDVSYYEVFLIDCILTERCIHLRFIIMHHMMAYCESKTKVLPYRCFLTRIFRVVRLNLAKEKDLEVANIYDTYNKKYLERMKFKKNEDDTWERRSGATPSKGDAPHQL